MNHQRDSLIPLLHNTQLHQHQASVTHQAEPASPIRRSHVTLKAEPKRHGSGGTTHCAEPPRGFEPRTYALRVRCSTPELRRPAPHAGPPQTIGQSDQGLPVVALGQQVLVIRSLHLRPRPTADGPIHVPPPPRSVVFPQKTVGPNSPDRPQRQPTERPAPTRHDQNP